jgi:2-dehydro-3-deoxygluconokinase
LVDTSRIVTFGEALLRLTPPGFQRLEQASVLEPWTAGAELNVAVALARLGERVDWVSRLPDNPLGRRLLAHARGMGVGTADVELSPDGRVGLLFVEVGQRPRATASLYDRVDSAFAQLDPDAFDWPALLDGARAFHTTGITPTLSDACRRATADALAAARALGCHTSFDLNYRARLATAADAQSDVLALAPHIDTLIGSATEARTVFGVDGDPVGAATRVRELTGIERVVLSSRVDRELNTQARRSVSVDGTVAEADSPEFRTVDPLGGGDAFTAGFLSGLLADGPQAGLELGGALAALKQSIPGDFAVIEPEEVVALVRDGVREETRR